MKKQKTRLISLKPSVTIDEFQTLRVKNQLKSLRSPKALAVFKEIDMWDKKSNNKIHGIYIQRCKYFIKHPPKNFMGCLSTAQKASLPT